MGRPARIKDMGVVVVGQRRANEEEDGVDRKENLAEHRRDVMT